MNATIDAPASEPRYVIEHEGVGRWRRGDVIPHSEFDRVGADVDRLLGMRSMRAASPLEYGQRHVDLASPEAALSYQHQLAEKDQQIARLASRVTELEQQLLDAGHRGMPPPPPREEARVFEEKDRVIQDLQTRLRAMTNQPAQPTPAAASAQVSPSPAPPVTQAPPHTPPPQGGGSAGRTKGMAPA